MGVPGLRDPARDSSGPTASGHGGGTEAGGNPGSHCVKRKPALASGVGVLGLRDPGWETQQRLAAWGDKCQMFCELDHIGFIFTLMKATSLGIFISRLRKVSVNFGWTPSASLATRGVPPLVFECSSVRLRSFG